MIGSLKADAVVDGSPRHVRRMALSSVFTTDASFSAKPDIGATVEAVRRLVPDAAGPGLQI